jgi:DNA adenine methylase
LNTLANYNASMQTITREYISDAAPILKWAGGKSQLLKQYQPFFPSRSSFQTYYEPFAGSAAVFFHLQPTHSLLADMNEQLIDLYKAIQQDVEGVIGALKQHRNEQEYYYEIRAQDPDELSPQERAARLIFLNKTCYNGLFRVNRSGRFNVPFGRYTNPTICNEKRLRAASQALADVELKFMDFEEAVDGAREGDFVYFDPPYVPLNSTSNFTSYHRFDFGTADHERLATTFHRLVAQNIDVMLSNSDTPLVRKLYGGSDYRVIEVQARRNINSKASRRGPITELLITNQTPSNDR